MLKKIKLDLTFPQKPKKRCLSKRHLWLLYDFKNYIIMQSIRFAGRINIYRGEFMKTEKNNSQKHGTAKITEPTVKNIYSNNTENIKAKEILIKSYILFIRNEAV